ncbi:MAG: hypothetical protein LC799_27995, partial [Actinobacteria bacterium]|nr:hypothetical protein [Actinomycetota bacterium]
RGTGSPPSSGGTRPVTIRVQLNVSVHFVTAIVTHGHRITVEYVERALADILDENAPVEPSEVRRGRPSLSGGHVHSPQITFRLPDQLHRQAVDAAEREGKTVSTLAREALERYLRQ